MADEQEVETTEEPQDNEKLLKALKSEREARKQAEKRVTEVEAAWQFRTKHNLDEETWELVKDLPTERAEALVARLTASAPTSEPPAGADAPKPAEAVFAAADALKGAPSGDTKVYTASEVQEIGLKDQAQALRIIAEGRMQAP